MTKIKVIIGNAETGKSLTAREIVKEKGLKTVFTSAISMTKKFDVDFFFRSCELDTQMIIIDEVRNLNILENFIFLFQEQIVVHQKCKNPFYITPQEVILVCSETITKEHIEDLGASVQRRIELIECTKESLEKQLQSLK